jgi:2-aminoadipate transaminase
MAPSISFLRGVPAEAVLEKMVENVADGYARAVRRYGTGVLQYGHFNGFKPLRERLAAGHGVDPDRILVGNGGMEVISLLLKTLPTGSTLLIEEATYDRVVLDAQRYGHRLVGVRLGPEGVDLDHLRQAVSRHGPSLFYGIPFHQNPTGVTYSGDNRSAVERICRDNGLLCAWDICYQALRYDGRENDVVALDDWGPILINSFTKTLTPGTKCGYLVLPADLAAKTTSIAANTRINPNLPTQAFISEFIASGGYQRGLEEICRAYRPAMDALNQSLGDHFAGAYPTPVTGGFFSCLDLPGIVGPKEADFVAAAKEAGVILAPAWDAVAPDLRAERQARGLFVRLTFPALAPDQIRQGVGAMAGVVQAFA